MDKIVSYYNGEYTEIYVHPPGEIVSDSMKLINNFFEINFLDFINNNYKNQNEIIDIGANIGTHSLFFLKFLNCNRVHSFEPEDSNLKILKKNTENFVNKRVIYDFALSNREGDATLYNSQQGNNGGFSLHSYSNGSSFVVKNSIPVRTLDSLNLNNITMIKIDVENHENEVLEGAKQTILRNKPIIFVENLFHGYPEKYVQTQTHIKKFLQN